MEFLEIIIENLVVAILILVTSCWGILVCRAIISHARTPAIRAAPGKNSARRFMKTTDRRIMPLVSVIVPARNEEENIGNCLLSLLAQSYSNLEIIAVDDGSDDNTFAVMKKIESDQGTDGRLKVISASDKPADWTGKTWASEQGFLASQGRILLFTDADSKFADPDAIVLAVDQMINDKLDVLTGVPYLPLMDLWSKMVMPVWNIFSEVFGNGIGDVNNPSSNVAFVMGSFFMIKRSVFAKLGTYAAVRDHIQEDREFGRRIKEHKLAMKMYKIDSLVTALWSRDLMTLWHGMVRTLGVMASQNRTEIFSRQAMMLTMIILPFLLLPISFSFAEPMARALSIVLNVSVCAVIVISIGTKILLKYRCSPMYSLFCVAGAGFLIACCSYTMIRAAFQKANGCFEWRGRMYQLPSQDEKVSRPKAEAV